MTGASSKRIWWLGGVALVALLVVGTVMLAQGRSKPVAPAAQVGQGAEASTSGTAGNATSDPAAAGSAGAPEGVVSSSKGASTGTKGAGSKGTSSKTTTTTVTQKPVPGKTVLVKVNFWNDTKNRKPSGASISVGSVSPWKLDATKTRSSKVIGPLPVATDLQLVICPDGPMGKRIAVTIRIDKNAKSNSDQDAIHVEIRDTSVRVIGNAVPNLDASFQR